MPRKTKTAAEQIKVEFTVPGIPLARKSHKIIRMPNGRPKPILDPACESHQNLLKLCASTAMKGRPPIQNMVEVSIWAFWPPVKSLKKATREWVANGGGLYYPKRADADNIAKNVLDGLKGIAITDDKLVVILHVYKRLRQIPGTDIEIKEILEFRGD